jgi:PKD repeat protein
MNNLKKCLADADRTRCRPSSGGKLHYTIRGVVPVIITFLTLYALVLITPASRATDLIPHGVTGSGGIINESPGQVVAIFLFPLAVAEQLASTSSEPEGRPPITLWTLVKQEVVDLGPTTIYYSDGSSEAITMWEAGTTQVQVAFWTVTMGTLTLYSGGHTHHGMPGEKCFRIEGSAIMHRLIPADPNSSYQGNHNYPELSGWPPLGWVWSYLLSGYAAPYYYAFHAMEWDEAWPLNTDGCVMANPIPTTGPVPGPDPFQQTFSGPQTVEPDPNVTIPGGNDSIVNYTWTLSSATDGAVLATVQGRNLSLYSMAPGDYILTLVGTDVNGVKITLRSSALHVPELAPIVAAFASPNPGSVGESITLDASGSRHPNANKSIVAYEWDLDNDGNYTDASGVTATTSFAAAGSHPVKLRVTDNNDPPQTAETTINVVIKSPPQIVCPPDSTILCAPATGLPVTLGVNVTDPGVGESLVLTLKEGDTVLDSQTILSPADNTPVTFNSVMLSPGAHALSISVGDGSDTAFCTATVTVVQDIDPPTITCPADREVNADPLVCAAVVCGIAPTSAGDNCSGFTIAYTLTGATTGSGSDDASGAVFNLGTTIVTYTITDAVGLTASCSFNVTVVNPAPVVTLAGPPSGSLYAVNAPATFTARFTDAGGGTHSGIWMFDNLSQAAEIVEPSGATPGSATATHSFTAAGVYKMKLTITDSCGESGTAELIDGMDHLVVVYDPSAGFVTGGGWINSPPGACAVDPALTGKATFGFVAKYLKGANVPSGNTEFQFKAGDLNFKSTSYRWLVVAGARAQFKGSGTINGEGNYAFILTAIDGQVNGGGGVDRFRIKIWDEAGGTKIYDNQAGTDDSAPLGDAAIIQGGSIVIQKAK